MPERRTLDRGFAGVAAEMNVGGGNPEVFGDRVQFVGRIRQWRQRLREPRAIDARALPELGIGRCRHAAGSLFGRAALVAATFLRRVEQRIAKTGHRFCALVLACKSP
jgi:hypothetical protein